MLFARVSSETQDVGWQLHHFEPPAARAGCQVVATIANKLSGAPRSRARRPDLHALLTLANGKSCPG